MKTTFLQPLRTVALLALLWVLPQSQSLAHDFEVEGIFYNITSEANREVEVTYQGESSVSFDEYNGEVTIPSSIDYNGNVYAVISVGEYAFNKCTNLTSVIISEGITLIESHAFQYCSNLVSVTIPKSVVSIGEGAFFSCTSLPNIVIPTGVIGGNVFNNCLELASVTISEGVTQIGSYAFARCISLTSIFIPKSVRIISGGVFSSCKNLTSIVVDPENDVYDSRNNCNAIIETKINCLREGCASTIIPEGIIEIGSCAFEELEYHRDLATIVIPEGVVTIGGAAFKDCINFDSITIPQSVELIGGNAFSGCKGLTTVRTYAITPPVCSSNAFNGVDAVLYVPKGTYEAYKEAEGWSSFSNIIDGEPIPDFAVNGLTYHQLGGRTVSLVDGRGKSGDVVIPETVSYEGTEYAVAEIGDTAFYQCVDLVSVTIPKSVDYVASKAFYECTGLKYVEIADGGTPLSFKDNYQFWTSPLDSAYIGRDLEYNGGTRNGGNSPFVGRISSQYAPIKKVVFGDSVRAVGNRLFQYCISLESVVLGENVAEIGTAFANCTGLKMVVCDAVTPPACRNAVFRNTSATLYVPEGTLEAYQAATGWKDFTKIIDAAYVPDFVVDGVKYTMTAKGEVGVVVINDTTKYEGDLVLPETVTYKDATYTLTTICRGAFNGCNNLKSVSIPATVTAIEEEAFYSCNPRIECKATTPPVCTSLSFYNASDKVYIPEGTRELYQAATGWKDFTYLIDAAYVPDFTVDDIRYTQVGKGKVGVAALVSLEMGIEILLPETVEYEGAVYSLTEICERAFSNWHLSSIVIPDGVTAIRDVAFYNCYQLKSIKLPDSLIVLGRGAFELCSQLRKITIPEGVTCIEHFTFQGCPIDTMTVKSTTPPNVRDGSFGTVYQSVGVLIVPTGALQAYMSAKYWQDFYKIEEESGCSNVFDVDGVSYKMASLEDSVVTVVGASASEIIIPDSVVYDKKYAVKVIGDRAFSGNTELESVVISEGVTTLGSFAFKDCTNLRSISIPSTLVNGSFSYNVRGHSTYSSAFYGCTGLESITVAEGHPNLDSRNGCNALIWTNEGWDGVELLMGCKTTVIPDGVTVIAEYAFHSTGIEKVAIPNSVTRLGYGAFFQCSNLTTLQIGSGLTEFSYAGDVSEPFISCYNLRTIVIDETNPLVDSRNNSNAIIETATNTILLGCNGTTIPEGVTAINPDAFSQCHYLESLYVPASLTSIPLGSFNGCRRLKSIVVDEANTMYDSRNNCNAIIETATDTLIRGCMNTVIPEDVVCIGHYAFAECLGLEEIVIPDAVHTIGSNAFQLCNYLRTITFGSGLKSIGSLPFGNIDWYFLQMFSLNSIVFKGSVPPVFIEAYGAFSDLMRSYIQLIVPEGSLTAYQSADVWRDFAHITEGEGAVEFEYDGICYRIIIGNDSAMVRPRLDKESATMESAYPDSIIIPETVWYDNKEYVVNAIGEYAFYNCELNHLSIPATVERVGYNGLSATFTGTVICYASIPPLCLESYNWGVSYDAVLRVPKESIELYEQAVFWQHFFRWANVEAIEDFTGIESAEADVPYIMQTDAVYDLSGRRITNTEHLKSGIYIVGGKKVVIK